MWRGAEMRKTNWPIYGAYALLALVVLGPLLRRGFVLSLDLVFTPHVRMPASVGNDYVFRVLLHVLHYVLPADVIEKIVLFLSVWLAAVGMYRLFEWTAEAEHTKHYRLSAAAPFFAGLFYAVNPFTYDRFMAGQYLVLLGYALLPWFARALLHFVGRPTWRAAIVLTVWTLAVSIVSIHAIGFMVILAAVGVVQAAWRRGDKVRLLKMSAVVAALFVLASGYWLLPLTLGSSTAAANIDSFSSTDRAAFSTVGDGVAGRLANVLRLQGFWAENRDLYTLPQAHIPGWGMLGLVIWGLVFVGGLRMWRDRRELFVTFGGSALLATVLAAGTLNNWLSGHVPFFAGYREPEKFVALVALAFAMFAGQGVNVALRRCRTWGGRSLSVVGTTGLLLVPIAWTSTIFWGFNNQLAAAAYPADWFRTNRWLDADKTNFHVLFLPWHLYMYFDFAGRIVANPTPQFFDKPVIASDNPEFKGIKPAPNTTDLQITTILARASGRNDLGAQLARLNVKYVLLAQDDDYANYSYLVGQRDLKLVRNGTTLQVYRNEAWREH